MTVYSCIKINGFFIFWYSNKCGMYVEAKFWRPFITY